MSNIQHYEKLIQEKRKKTPFRDFVKDLASWDVLNLYKRNGKISRYPENDRIRVLDDAEFQNASSYSREYDLGKSFFANFRALSDIFPYQYLLKFLNNENADFADAIFGAKNAYLSFVIGVDGENVTYSAFSYGNTTNIHNCFFACKNVSNAYMSAGITTSHNIFYSKYITDSSNIWFSSNLIGCEECIGCDGLQNQKYAIGNRVLSREEYLMKKGEILRDKKGFDRYYQHVCDKKAINFASENVTGNFIIKSHHVENGGWIANIHNSRNVLVGNGDNGSEHFYDSVDVGVNAQNLYGVMSA